MLAHYERTDVVRKIPQYYPLVPVTLAAWQSRIVNLCVNLQLIGQRTRGSRNISGSTYAQSNQSSQMSQRFVFPKLIQNFFGFLAQIFRRFRYSCQVSLNSGTLEVTFQVQLSARTLRVPQILGNHVPFDMVRPLCHTLTPFQHFILASLQASSVP